MFIFLASHISFQREAMQITEVRINVFLLTNQTMSSVLLEVTLLVKNEVLCDALFIREGKKNNHLSCFHVITQKHLSISARKMANTRTMMYFKML